MASPLFDAPSSLIAATNAVNESAFTILGSRDHCILSAHALSAILRDSFPVRLARVTLGIFPNDRKYLASVLGSDGCGGPRYKADEGMWKGHLAVLVDEQWLCDSTSDQSNRPGIKLPPLVVKLHSLNPRESTFFKVNDCDCRYSLYHIQNGFKSAPDARPSHWKDVEALARKLLVKGGSFAV